ncbi:hypothetical protein [Prescottella subtropica]|uniref:hypothetical protein n=1 Tax=Prescottella subtropica TaxID=2545757 RepID=UPI0010F6381A|nr:hypothetical protein [Prescottella subtropica]
MEEMCTVLLDSTTDIAPIIAPFITAFSYVLILAGVVTTFTQAGRVLDAGQARSAGLGVGAGLGAVGAGVTLRQLARTQSADSSTDAPDSAGLPEPLPEPKPLVDPTGDPAGGFDPLILLIALGVLGALGLVVLMGFSVHRRIVGRREKRQSRERDWATARAVYTGVLDDYAVYLSDPYAWLDRPMLEDVNEPCTAAFLDALGVAQSLDLDVVPADQQRIELFRVAATDLRAAWDEADRAARAAVYEPASRRKLRRAAGALRTALDESATAEERESAAEAVHRLTAGLVDAPRRILDPVTAAITGARRKELTVGPTR